MENQKQPLVNLDQLKQAAHEMEGILERAKRIRLDGELARIRKMILLNEGQPLRKPGGGRPKGSKNAPKGK